MARSPSMRPSASAAAKLSVDDRQAAGRVDRVRAQQPGSPLRPDIRYDDLLERIGGDADDAVDRHRLAVPLRTVLRRPVEFAVQSKEPAGRPSAAEIHLHWISPMRRPRTERCRCMEEMQFVVPARRIGYPLARDVGEHPPPPGDLHEGRIHGAYVLEDSGLQLPDERE